MKKSKLTLNKEVISKLNDQELTIIRGGEHSLPNTACPGYTCDPTCENPGPTQDPGCGGPTIPCLVTNDTCEPTCNEPGPTQEPGCGGPTVNCQG